MPSSCCWSPRSPGTAGTCGETPILRDTWGKVFADAPSLCAALVIALFLIVTLLDSVHYRRALPPIRDGRGGRGRVRHPDHLAPRCGASAAWCNRARRHTRCRWRRSDSRRRRATSAAEPARGLSAPRSWRRPSEGPGNRVAGRCAGAGGSRHARRARRGGAGDAAGRRAPMAAASTYRPVKRWAGSPATRRACRCVRRC